MIFEDNKNSEGVTTTHIWDGSNVVMDVTGVESVRYIRGINLIKSDKHGFYLFNAHGDVVQLADTAGTVTKAYRYDAYGVEKEPDKGDQNPFRYCAEYFDKETGSIYLRARYYEPRTGRFRNEDSYRGQDKASSTLNLYTYCINSPIQYKDSSGNIAVVDDAILIYMGTTLIMSATAAWLASPEGQKFINDNADALQSAAMKIYQVAENGVQAVVDISDSLIPTKQLSYDSTAGTWDLGELKDSKQVQNKTYTIPAGFTMASSFVLNLDKKKQEEYKYYAAYLDFDTKNIYIGQGISLEEAQKIILGNVETLGVFSFYRQDALELVKGLGTAKWNDAHKGKYGFYKHFHLLNPNGTQQNAHAWYFYEK